MKTFKFEITIKEEHVDGDEFWEQALENDGTGIADLTYALKEAIKDSNLVAGDLNDIVKLKSYTDESNL